MPKQKIRFYVDLPNPEGKGSAMLAIDSFDTREEAIAFCQENYGADRNGCIDLISEVDDGEFEEDSDE